jgi:ribosome maturation factor RimP
VLSKTGLWSELETLVREEGLELFDVDMPNRQSGVVRIFIAKRPMAEARVSVEDCERVSRKIAAHEKLGALRAEFLLEVSSPGINRRLQRPEHFEGAIGERVQVTVRDAEHRNEVVVGRLVACNAREIELEVEGGGQKARFALDAITKARVDFLFDKG